MFGWDKVATGVLDIAKRFIKDPKLQQEFQLALLEQEKSFVSEINQTIRAEAKSEHWMVWSWRPLVGYVFAGTIVNNYILLPYFASYGLQPVNIDPMVWSAMLVVLGVSAGTRGWEKIQRNK